MTKMQSNFAAVDEAVMRLQLQAYEAARKKADELGVTMTFLHDEMQLEGHAEACQKVLDIYQAVLLSAPVPEIKL